MTQTMYRDQDYVFGQLMLTLRTRIGLTQISLADYLGVSRRAIGSWESGSKYPKPHHLKAFIELAAREQVFPPGQEEDEIRALWRVAHQKVLLDDLWLDDLLGKPSSKNSAGSHTETPALGSMNWDAAPAVPHFYGRVWEQKMLQGWVGEDRCRVVSIVGMGGIGKSALAVSVMYDLVDFFDVVIWRSLRDLPYCEALLQDLLQVLEPQLFLQEHGSTEEHLGFLMDCLRKRRILIVLDNLESVLEESNDRGSMRPGFEGFARFLQLSAETGHQSTVLLTTREKPGVLVPYEGTIAAVRTLRLTNLDATACEALLTEQGLSGTSSECVQLIESYAGNPLALKIVSQTIVDLFDGAILPFLDQGEIIYGGIRELLSVQFNRLSTLEQAVVFWLAILREPVTFNEIDAVLVRPVPRVRLLETVEALHRRSLIERGQKAGSFTLQSVVLEYVTTQLITEVSNEIEQGSLLRTIEYGLELTQVDEYVRDAQERLIVSPILDHLRSKFTNQAGVEEQLIALLAQLSTQPDDVQGYGPANLVTVLRLYRGNLRNLDLSKLALRSIYLQDVEMQNTRLDDSVLLDSIFTGTFDTIIAIAVSPTGEYWAGSSRSGELWLWDALTQTLIRTWHAHADLVWALTFSPDGNILASGGWDGMVKLWDVVNDAMLWLGSHGSHINGLSFSPDGSMVASSGGHQTIVWDVKEAIPVVSLVNPSTTISGAWSPDGKQFVTGDIEGAIRFWEIERTGLAVCVQTLKEHTNTISGLEYSPDGSTLASGSYDGTVKLWDVAGAYQHTTLTGHSERVQRIAWSPDGRTLASSGFEKVIWLWDINQQAYHSALQGHADIVIGLAFTPDGRNLVSSGGGVLRVWDMQNNRCLRSLKGNAISILDIDWSPDSTQLVSAGSDASVIIWDISGETPPHVLRGHRRIAFGVSWRADGQQIASSSWDGQIRLWNPASGEDIQVLQGTRIVGNLLYGVAWSPDGQRLASATFMSGIQIFENTVRQSVLDSDRPSIWIRQVAWSPDGMLLAGSGDDGAVYVWDADGILLQRWLGHRGTVTSVSWSPDGTMLASAGGGTQGDLIVWDMKRGSPVKSFEGHHRVISAVAWGSNEDFLVSGGGNGKLCWWDLRSGECIMMRDAHRRTIQAIRTSPDRKTLASCGDDGAIILWNLHSGERLQTLRRDRPYEGLSITGIRGLTEAQKLTLSALGAIEDHA